MNDMDEKKYAVQLTDAQEVKLLECDSAKEIFDIGREAIGCEWIELVEPEPLARDGLLLMIDEEGKLKGEHCINCIASHLYGSEHRGDSIIGDAVIVKSSGERLMLLTESEAKQIAAAMAQIRKKSIEKIADAFGLRPVLKQEAERQNRPHRQPCKKNFQER